MMFWKKPKGPRLQLEGINENTYLLQRRSHQEIMCEYVLQRPWGDGDPDFSRISLLIMQELLEPYQVVTYVYDSIISYEPAKKKTHGKDVCFLHQYYRFLKAHDMTENVFFYCPKELITLTNGMDLPLMRLLMDDDAKEIWHTSNHVYAYRSYPFRKNSYEELKQALDSSRYLLYLQYEEYHDLLTIQFDSTMISQDYISDIVRKVCKAHGKVLEISSLII